MLFNGMKNRQSMLLVAMFVGIQCSGVYAASIISEGCRDFVSLDGEWDVLPINGLAFDYPPPKSGWEKEAVPNENGRTRTIPSDPYTIGASDPLKSGKIEKTDKMASWFRRSFILPDVLPVNKRVFLRFDGIAFRSEAWLNGKKIGTSVQCAVPVEYDVTNVIKPGENLLVVGVTGVEGVIDLENKTLITPAFGMCAGIRGGVSLRFLPETYIDDVFVKTSVKNKKLVADVTIVNASGKNIVTTPYLTVYDWDDVPQLATAGQPVELKSGETKTVSIKKDWIAPTLWQVGNGALYNAHVTLRHDEKTTDEYDQRFGFREFRAQGRDFYLNDAKTTLLRNSMLTSMGAKSSRPLIPDVRSNPKSPYNCYRLHLGQNNKAIMDEADKAGLMIQPESSWNQVRCYPLDKKDIWLPNTLEYYRRWVKLNRNRPSVIMWTLANETFWGNVPENPDMKKIGEEIVKTVREMDPTRPLDGDAEVGWDGLLDVISIHYPGVPGRLKQQYPNSGVVVPNDLYWLKDKANRSWRATFDWDKPLSIGEYWHISGSPDNWASCGGEDVYDWYRYSTQDIKGRDGDYGSCFSEMLKKITDAYRLQGVACLNPWSGNAEFTMPRVAVRPLDFHPNFYGGKTVEKKVVVFYESSFHLDYPRLQCFITIDGKKVWEKTIRIQIKPGDRKVFELPITPPKVTRQEAALLTVRFIFHAGGDDHEKARFLEDIFILPKQSFPIQKFAEPALLDPKGNVAKKMEKIGLKLTPLKQLDQQDLEGKKLLIIGSEAKIKSNKKTILDFARKGGSVLFLRRDVWGYLGKGFPEQDLRHVASRTWKRRFDHPVLDGVDDKQLSYWRPDNLVGRCNFLKPYDGDIKVIIDAAGTRGLEWTPLCETSYGKGVLIFSQLDLINKIGTEPVADRLLINLMDYGLNYSRPTQNPLRLLCGDNKMIEEILKVCRIKYVKGLDGSGPVLVDASYTLSATEQDCLKQDLKNGGKVWLHGFSPQNVGKISGLFPFKPVLKSIDPKITTAVRLSDSPLMNNLSTRDFFWARVNLGVRGGYLKDSTPTAKLGEYELELPNLNAGDSLLVPALLTEVPVGDGQILFDTLAWEKAFDTEGDNVVRIISALTMNLGGEIEKPDEEAYDYFSVDLAPFANMGYVDEIEQDGEGGWLDMGKADLCFFLINHTGLENGVGMPVAVPEFPENTRFLGVPFQLTAPKKNNGKGMIALRGSNRALKLPDNVTDIPVGRKADQLFFIQSASYVPKEKGVTLARYVIHYEDGTIAEFPIRSWIEIGDWCGPKKVAKARICWTGNNRILNMVGLYMTPWNNPHPDKIIKSIDLAGALTNAQLGLIGISGAVKKNDDAQQTLAEWQLGSLVNGKIQDSLGNCALTLYKKPTDSPNPRPCELAGEKALKLTGTQCLNGNLAKITDFDPEKPFSVNVLFSIDELPKAHNRLFGVYQAMDYLKSGFRVMVGQDGRLVVSIFTAPKKAFNFRGKTQLRSGIPYSLSLYFEEGQMKLTLNGKLELVAKCPMPAPFKRDFIVGHASGMGWLKGVVSRLNLRQ